MIYDTLSGEIKPAEFDYLNGNTVISARLYEYDSLLLRLYDGCSEGQYTEPEEREDKKIAVPARRNMSSTSRMSCFLTWRVLRLTAMN